VLAGLSAGCDVKVSQTLVSYRNDLNHVTETTLTWVQKRPGIREVVTETTLKMLLMLLGL
jgi:hypothetical protein